MPRVLLIDDNRHVMREMDIPEGMTRVEEAIYTPFNCSVEPSHVIPLPTITFFQSSPLDRWNRLQVYRTRPRSKWVIWLDVTEAELRQRRSDLSTLWTSIKPEGADLSTLEYVRLRVRRSPFYGCARFHIECIACAKGVS